MKRFRKTISFFMAFVCAITLIACAPKDENKTTSPTKETLVEGQQDVFDRLASVATENAAAEVGTYVIPPESDFDWEETEGGVALEEYTGTETAVEIPAQLGGANVVEIRSGAFQGSNIVGVKLPDTIQILSEKAFFYCTTLIEISFGSGVKSIGESCFQGCVALSRIEMNSGLENIGKMAFSMCQMLTALEIPDTVQTIEKGAFVMCGLESVTLPESIELVGEQAFVECEMLTSVVVESGVGSIGDEAFRYCKALQKVEIKDATTEIGWASFSDCPEIVIFAPSGSLAETYAKENDIQFKSN